MKEGPAMLILPEVFSDHMVLQREKPICIWGMSSQDGSVTLGEYRVFFTCREDKFDVYLPAMEAADNLTLTITSGNQVMQFTDVSVGEVFFAGGQSNMALPLEVTPFGELQPDQRIRFFTEPHYMAEDDDSQTVLPVKEGLSWLVADGQCEKKETAIGYYFARELAHHTDCTIGILSCNIGASRADAWMSPTWLQAMDLQQYLTEVHCDQNYYKFNLNHWLYFHKYLPVNRYTIRSVLWYQGESNRGMQEAKYYDKILGGMIANWRADNRTPNLPFFLVQLMPYNESESTGDWYHIREAQERLSKTIPNVYMITLHESGENEEIHPVDKEPIGIALSNAVRTNCFGENTEYSGPILDSWHIDGDNLVLSFTHADGLTFRGEPQDLYFLTENGKIPAQISINNNQVIIKNSLQKEKLCMGFCNAPQHNLYNSAGYLASPFQLNLSEN